MVQLQLGSGNDAVAKTYDAARNGIPVLVMAENCNKRTTFMKEINATPRYVLWSKGIHTCEMLLDRLCNAV